MPVDPHTWADNQDFLTAKLLNGDLRCYNGQEFTPTGVNLHARRPVYKSFNRSSAASVVADGNWTPAYAATLGGQQSSPVGDTGGLYGRWMDPYQSGNINLRMNGGGGTSGSQGGLILVSGFALWPSFSSGAYAAGLGPANGSVSTSDGTFQGANSTTNGCAMAVDILDGNNANRWCLFGYNNSGGFAAPAASDNLDGSGKASRLHSHWISSYPGNGTILTAIPGPVTSWSSSSPLDATTLNSKLRDVLRYLNMPPVLRVQSSSGGNTLTGGAANVINLPAATYDTYGAWAASANTYTVPLDGLYFTHGVVTTQNFSGEIRVGININGTSYWGPRALMPATGEAGAAKTQIFSLKKGDAIQLVAWPSVNATQSSAHTARLVITQVANAGSPTITVTPPDTTYRWSAGTPGPLDSLFNAHLANDLEFLTYRPYLLSHQLSTQSGIAMNAATAVTMDTVQGLPHNDSGDNYGGWNATNHNYVAPADGWYMAVSEVFLNNPSLTATPWVSAAFTVSPNGTTSWDTFQRQNMATVGQYPGAAGLSYYYLRAGDTITPGVLTAASSATTISTAVAAPQISSHFELVWLGE